MRMVQWMCSKQRCKYLAGVKVLNCSFVLVSFLTLEIGTPGNCSAWEWTKKQTNGRAVTRVAKQGFQQLNHKIFCLLSRFVPGYLSDILV